MSELESYTELSILCSCAGWCIVTGIGPGIDHRRFCDGCGTEEDDEADEVWGCSSCGGSFE